VLGHSSLGVLPPGQLTIVPRGSDLNPDDRGDWGVQARWSPEWLDGTLGFYYRETADILPQTFLSAPDVTAGDAYIDFTAPDSACGDLAPVDDFGGLAGCANAQLGGNLVNSLAQAKYGLAYAEDIEIYGISVSKNIGGVSIGSDLNYRRNMPLSSIAAIFSPNLAADINSVVYGNFGAGYEPVSLVTALPARSPGTGVVSDATANNSTFATGDTLHFTVNALATFADTPVFDSAVLIAEVGYSNLLSLDSKNSALYKGRSTYRGIDASDRDNLVFTTAFTPTWYEVLPGIDMTAPLALSVGVYGNSPVQAGGNEGAGNYSLGVGALIYNKYFVDLKYVDAFGRRDNCNASPASTVAGAPAAGDGSTPNALGVNEGYTCYEGSVSSFSGPGAAIQDRGAVYLTLKTTI
jgi:hypothetical protein